MMPALLALDWGTSSLRAYLLAAADDKQAQSLASRNAPWGIMHLPAGGYTAALEELCGDWLRQFPSLPVLAAGMVGSAQGWVEAPYVPCPAAATQLAAGLASLNLADARAGYIVPGVIQAGELPDVMRGEETQIMGAQARQNHSDGLFILPGTHSKWVMVRQGTIERFSTFMTGELFAVLRKHTILAKLMSEDQPAEDAFQRGLDIAQREGNGGLSAVLFSVRTLGLTQTLRGEQLADYLSGLLIGFELAGALDRFGPGVHFQAVTLIGEPALCARYRTALNAAGFGAVHSLTNASENGLWHIAGAAGLLDSG